MNDFASFPPPPQALEIAGLTLALSPIRIGELPALLAAIQPFASELAAGEPDWLGLLGTQGEGLLEALALAARQPKEWVQALTLEEAVRLATAVFEVNADFFVQRVVPAIHEAAARLDRNVWGVGTTRSTA